MEITKSQIELYRIRGAKNGGWADISINEGYKSGRISISSGQGSWSYYWGACGESFKKFLCGLDISYTSMKFGCGNVFDQEATIKEWKQTVIKERRDEDIDAEKARELFDEIKSMESEDQEMMKVMVWNSGILSFFEGVPPMHTRIDPAFEWFWDNV